MKTDIEYAALVMGERVIHDCNEFGARITGQEDEWNPRQDDGDSRRLEIACLTWTHKVYPDWAILPDGIAWAVNEYNLWRWRNAPEQYRAAVFVLAVAIGKVIDGGGV